MTYREKLRDPRWQQLRLMVMQRDGWRCKSVACVAHHNSRVMLVVHHNRYIAGLEPWDYQMDDLITLCVKCHDAIHEVAEPETYRTMIKGHFYHWQEIGQLVGHEPFGYLTQVNQNIVCGCFRKDKNPDAPSIVLPGGTDSQWLAKARLFQQQVTPIPVFIKAEGLPWEFVGKFRVEAITENAVEIQIHRERYQLDDIGAVMFLREDYLLPPDFFSACKKTELVPTQFIVTVSIAEQTVSLFEQNKFVKKFPCSTSRFGIGQAEGSKCTPLGLHRIAEKIGAGEPAGTVFKSRKVVGHTSQPEFTDAKITTRILWLEGLEPGLNQGFNGGVNVDTHARYVYIHGTADQSSIGRPDSCGCIHLADADLIPLFDLLPGGTLVWIGES